MIKPPLLVPGDSIGILAPARKVSNGDIAKALEIFRSRGFHVVLSKNIHSDDHSYLSSTDEKRLEDLQTFLDDPEIKAIVAARGGYGSTRILDSIHFNRFLKNPKWIVGFSDITAIHLKLLSLKVMSIHGTMPLLFPKPDSAPSIESLFHVLLNGDFTLSAGSNPCNRPGKSVGRIIGGNLSLITDSIGTRSEPETQGCILVIEETDEPLYRIDRMMTHLKRAGKLSGLKGVVAGHMTEMKNSELPFGENVEQLILNAVSDYQYPVAFGFPTGHQNPNLAWIHGDTVTLNVSSGGSALSSMP